MIYCHTRLNCVYDSGSPSRLATTYSEVATSFASRRHSVRTEGSGMSRLADFVFRSDEITGRLCSECHALCTERYGASASRNTQSHFNAKISSRHKPAYRPIITNTYGGSPLMATRSLSTCSSVSASRSFCGFPPLEERVSQGQESMILLSTAE